MNEHVEDSVLLVLVKAFAAAAPAFVLIYLTDEDFRTEVDRLIAEARYQLRRASWLVRVWNRLQPWEQEYLEQKGGGR